MNPLEEAAKANLRKLIEVLFQKRLARMPAQERILLEPAAGLRMDKLRGKRNYP